MDEQMSDIDLVIFRTVILMLRSMSYDDMTVDDLNYLLSKTDSAKGFIEALQDRKEI